MTFLSWSKSYHPGIVFDMFQILFLHSPGVSRQWYTGYKKVELELQESLGLTGGGMNCCGREYLITAAEYITLTLPS